jgi:hypothetical protein
MSIRDHWEIPYLFGMMAEVWIANPVKLLVKRFKKKSYLFYEKIRRDQPDQVNNKIRLIFFKWNWLFA